MELTIIILYLLAIFGVGIYCNKFNKGLDDYLVAGRRLGVGLATGTLVATYFGGGYVIGVGGEAFSTGLSAYWSPIAGGLGILAVCLILKKMEGMKLYTVTEIVERRYICNASDDGGDGHGNHPDYLHDRGGAQKCIRRNGRSCCDWSRLPVCRSLSRRSAAP